MKHPNSVFVTIPVISFFYSLFNKTRPVVFSSNQNNSHRFKFQAPKIRFNKSQLTITTFTVFSVVIVTALIWLFFNKTTPVKSNVDKIDIQSARATKNINREFVFPLNDKGQEISKIKLNLENVELRDEIVVSGKRATAVKGRTFLIINLKIKNEHTQAVQINSRDYIRLIVNNDQENPLAPDIHNDPIEVQAISTKPSRVGFAINESDKNLKLRVGEIKGEKTTIDLNF